MLFNPFFKSSGISGIFWSHERTSTPKLILECCSSILAFSSVQRSLASSKLGRLCPVYDVCLVYTRKRAGATAAGASTKRFQGSCERRDFLKHSFKSVTLGRCTATKEALHPIHSLFTAMEHRRWSGYICLCLRCCLMGGRQSYWPSSCLPLFVALTPWLTPYKHCGDVRCMMPETICLQEMLCHKAKLGKQDYDIYWMRDRILHQDILLCTRLSRYSRRQQIQVAAGFPTRPAFHCSTTSGQQHLIPTMGDSNLAHVYGDFERNTVQNTFCPHHIQRLSSHHLAWRFRSCHLDS